MRAEALPAGAGERSGRGGWWRRGSGAILVGAFLAALAAAPAQAASPYREVSGTWVDCCERGGRNVELILDRSDHSGWEYVTRFYAWGERLELTDRYADGHAARAEVRVYNKSGSLVDTDTFYTTQDSPTSRDINMGTPDGSGNIPEGYEVRIKLCINETSICTSALWGKA